MKQRCPKAWGFWLVAALVTLVHSPHGAAQTPAALSYQLELRPNIDGQLLHAQATLTLPRAVGGTALLVRSPNLQIQRAWLDGQLATAVRTEAGWSITQPAGLADSASGSLSLQLHYSAGPAAGLVFGPNYVYTAYDSCHWLPCVGDLIEGARLQLTLITSPAHQVAASGTAVPGQPPGKHRFDLADARPLFTLGFAVGAFQQVVVGGAAAAPAELPSPPLRVLAPSGAGPAALSHADLKARFKESPQVLAFLQRMAGMPLPYPSFTQVLVPGNVAQEATGFVVIGQAVLDPILETPDEDWVIVHEMAHQWWGTLVACAEWRDFWLNEGLVSYLTAAWKQHRWGAAAYQRELALAQRRWQRAKDAGFDRPLSWPGTYPSLGSSRAIHYSKGMLFMHTLRQQLGDDAFFAGLRHYTRNHANQRVYPADLQRALEATSGQPLGDLFLQWVGPR